jgi:hypothetical protein
MRAQWIEVSDQVTMQRQRVEHLIKKKCMRSSECLVPSTPLLKNDHSILSNKTEKSPSIHSTRKHVHAP